MGKHDNPYSKKRVVFCEDTGEQCTGDKYLSTKHWKALRLKVYEHFHGECQRCHSVLPLEQAIIHHRTYSRFGNENIKDLVLYCGRCHTIIHAAKGNSRAMHTALNEMMRELTDEERYEICVLIAKLRGENVDEYINACFDISKKRQDAAKLRKLQRNAKKNGKATERKE